MTDNRKVLRDKRLDDLQKATTKWANEEITRLESESAFLKAVLEGRTGAGRLANQNVADSSKRLDLAISQFLVG